MKQAPFPQNEMGRITTLSDLNVDYTNLDDTFKDLVKLAAKVTGTPVSMVNIIDNYTTWTVSSYGSEVSQTAREQSICQFTILERDHYAVNDLTVHPNFKDEAFVNSDPHFRFYLGVPLAMQEHNLGALCVLDNSARSISAEKIEMLKIIADEIINRLKTLPYIEALKTKVTEVKQTQNKVIHDIRGPIAGIMGLAEIISMQGEENKLDEVLDFVRMMHKGGKSVLELADEILTEEKKAQNKSRNEMSLATFKKRLEELYIPQARSKDVVFNVNILSAVSDMSFPQNKLMQIAGNLISNAIKFTPREGSVTALLDVAQTATTNTLKITINDTGAGMDADQVSMLLADNTASADGTDGEKGFGFGLALVKHLVKGLGGTFNIASKQGVGSVFSVVIPYEV